MFRRLFGGSPAAGAASVDAAEAQRRLAAREAIMIDVRERDEWRAGHVAGARHIPLGELTARVGELPRDRDLLLFCRSGNRSGGATRLLRGQGFERAYNVEGGIIAWAQHGLPVKAGA